MARVFRYSYAQAKTRALQGKLLNSEDWHFLLRMKSLDQVIKYLGGTSYAEFLSDATTIPEPQPESLTLALYRALFKDYAGLMRSVPVSAARLLTALVTRYEAENLKTILRGIWRATPAGSIRSLLYDLGALSRLPTAGLLQVNQISAAVNLLRGTLYHGPLAHALAQFTAQGRPFPLEIAVDLAVLEHLGTAARSLQRMDRQGANKLTGSFFDYLNLTWLVRWRYYYDLSPEEAINYTVPGGLFLSLKQLGRLARCADLPTFLSALDRPYRNLLQAIETWQQVESLLRQWLIGQLLTSIRGDPFQIRLQIAYLLLKECEIEALRSLFSAIQLQASGEGMLRFATLPLRGPIRV